MNALTGGVVEHRSRRAGARLVVGEDSHEICIAAVAVEVASGAGGVAPSLRAIISLHKGSVIIYSRDLCPV